MIDNEIEKYKEKIQEIIKEEIEESKYIREIDNFKGSKEKQEGFADGYYSSLLVIADKLGIDIEEVE